MRKTKAIAVPSESWLFMYNLARLCIILERLGSSLSNTILSHCRCFSVRSLILLSLYNMEALLLSSHFANRARACLISTHLQHVSAHFAMKYEHKGTLTVSLECSGLGS